MAEYIERDRLIEDLTELAKYQTGERQQGILGVIETIRIRKAADVAPVRHGRWVMKKTSAGAYYTLCSHCNSSVKYNDEYGTAIMNLKGANYCPNCGAKMDEEVSE